MFPVMVKNLVKLHHPYIFVMVEPRINGREPDRVIKRLRFSRSHRVEAMRVLRGIWIMWKEELVTMDILIN